jgi:hypothetical protein
MGQDMNAPHLSPLVAAVFGISALACGGETVTDPPPDDVPIDAVVVSPPGATVSGIGATQQFTAEVQDLTGLLQQAEAVTWTSLNPEVATIDAAGMATVVASGQVTVAAEANDLVGYALLTASVPEATPVASWSASTSGTSQDLYDIWGTSSSDIYAVGQSGTILHYDGTVWSAMTSGTTDELYGVWGSTSSDIYAVGRFGTILHYDGIRYDPALRWNRLG